MNTATAVVLVVFFIVLLLIFYQGGRLTLGLKIKLPGSSVDIDINRGSDNRN